MKNSDHKQKLACLLREMHELEKYCTKISNERGVVLNNIKGLDREIQSARILLGQLGENGAVAPLFAEQTEEVKDPWLCRLKNRIDEYTEDIKKLVTAKEALWVLDRKEYIKSAPTNIDRDIDNKNLLRSMLEEEIRLGTSTSGCE